MSSIQDCCTNNLSWTVRRMPPDLNANFVPDGPFFRAQEACHSNVLLLLAKAILPWFHSADTGCFVFFEVRSVRNLQVYFALQSQTGFKTDDMTKNPRQNQPHKQESKQQKLRQQRAFNLRSTRSPPVVLPSSLTWHGRPKHTSGIENRTSRDALHRASL